LPRRIRSGRSGTSNTCGLVDLEFIAQYLLLRHAAARPEILTASVDDAFGRLGRAGLLASDEAEQLAAAARLLQQVQAMLRLTVEGEFAPDTATAGLKAALARAAGAPSFEALESSLREREAFARRAFAQHIAEPAAKLAAQQSRENRL
jgi:glutamate-ammonia-ligase adenylyltransferase